MSSFNLPILGSPSVWVAAREDPGRTLRKANERTILPQLCRSCEDRTRTPRVLGSDITGPGAVVWIWHAEGMSPPNPIAQVTLGTAYHHYTPYAFGQTLPDRLLHTYVIGQTGTGKSTLIENLARQDLNRGQGFCLIDPHGELAEALSDHPHVLHWRVSDPNAVMGYNPLLSVSASRRHLVVSGLIEALKKQWADAWGPRMEHLLRYAVLALLEQPQADLRDIMRLFLESDFQKQAIPRISDPLVHAFWTKEYPAMNYRTSADGVAPLANKLGALLSNPVVRNALCAPDQPLRFRTLMDAQQSLVINLSKGQLGADTANVMGGLLLASLVNAAFSRADTKATNRTPFILYVDEFHHFSTGVFADALSECRKYGLGAVLAQQYTTQTDRDVLEAIFGNVGTILALRVGALDAPMIAKQLLGVSPEQLILQPSYRAFVQMILRGQKQIPFSADLHPPRRRHRGS